MLSTGIVFAWENNRTITTITYNLWQNLGNSAHRLIPAIYIYDNKNNNNWNYKSKDNNNILVLTIYLVRLSNGWVSFELWSTDDSRV